MSKNATTKQQTIVDQREPILQQIRALDREEAELRRRPKSVEEQIEQFNSRVDVLAAEWEKFAGRSGDYLAILAGRIPPERQAEFNCWLHGDVLKKRHAESARANSTGDEISSAEKDRELTKIVAERISLWKEYETLSTQYEAAGLSVDRDPQIPVEILLSWHPRERTYNEAKLKRILTKIGSINAEIQTLAQDRTEADQEIAREQRVLATLTDYPRHSQSDLQAQSDKISQARERRGELQAKIDALNEAAKVPASLRSRCENFLREHRVSEGDRPGVLSGIPV